jgi:hypothetical protein
VTFLAPLARAAQGKHGNVRILARSYGTAKTQLSSSVQLFLSMLMLLCRHFLLNMPSLLRCVFSMAAAITAGSQKMDSQAKELQSVLFLNFRPHTESMCNSSIDQFYSSSLVQDYQGLH